MSYKRDQARVAAYAASPAALVDVIALVLLSIRQPWHAIGDQLADVREHRAESKYLFGFKRSGYLYAVEHARALFAMVERLRAGEADEVDAMRELMKVPGLGMPKAGFVLQLVAGVAGCMDSHNIKRFGLDASFFRIPKRAREADQIAITDDRIRAYLALCEACGGCEYLWDSWCDLIAAKNPKRYRDGGAVSALHADFLEQ